MRRRLVPPPRRLVVIWLVAATVTAITAVLSASGRAVPGEEPVFDAVNGLPGPRPVERLVEVVMAAGTVPAGVLVVALFVGATGRLRPGLGIAAAFVATRVVTEVLKETVGRARPVGVLPVEHVRSTADGMGFPSGHTANAVVLALMVGFLVPRLRWPLIAVAALVGVARIYVGVHLPLDVVGGAALAVCATSVGWLVGSEPAALPRRSTGSG